MVYDKSSDFFKVYETLLTSSFKIKKLKKREELTFFINNLMRIIDDNDMNIKSELDTFYETMFENEKIQFMGDFTTKAEFTLKGIKDFKIDTGDFNADMKTRQLLQRLTGLLNSRNVSVRAR